jgi:hypothetical protein
MPEYDNSNSFVLFKNDKDGVEARPDYTGTIELEDGNKLRLAAWVKESKTGNKFLSGRVSEIQVAASAGFANRETADDDF